MNHTPKPNTSQNLPSWCPVLESVCVVKRIGKRLSLLPTVEMEIEEWTDVDEAVCLMTSHSCNSTPVIRRRCGHGRGQVVG